MSEFDDRAGPDDDEGMLGLLADLGGADPPPEALFEAGRAIWSWRSIDDELAELAHDSEEAAGELAGVRGGGDLRQLHFESPRLSFRVEVTPGPPARLTGQLSPPAAAVVEVRTPERTTTVEADEHGRFQLAGLQPGPLSLRCVPGGGGARPVATAWVVL